MFTVYLLNIALPITINHSRLKFYPICFFSIEIVYIKLGCSITLLIFSRQILVSPLVPCSLQILVFTSWTESVFCMFSQLDSLVRLVSSSLPCGFFHLARHLWFIHAVDGELTSRMKGQINFEEFVSRCFCFSPALQRNSMHFVLKTSLLCALFP